MDVQWISASEQREQMTGVERLSLRVSSMINHPVAQMQRWVTVHRLDSDGQAEWDEVIGVLAETPELDLSFNDDGTFTVRWERLAMYERGDFMDEHDSAEQGGQAPF